MNKNKKIQYLLEKISKLDKIIELHLSNPSTFMIDQYRSEKKKIIEEISKLSK